MMLSLWIVAIGGWVMFIFTTALLVYAMAEHDCEIEGMSSMSRFWHCLYRDIETRCHRADHLACWQVLTAHREFRQTKPHPFIPDYFGDGPRREVE